MKITRTSPFTGKQNTMDLDITNEQIQKYNKGELIQKCFPQLSSSEREFILSGYTQEDWDLIFKEEKK